jgi:FAD/FMN-containing dehydrogenase
MIMSPLFNVSISPFFFFFIIIFCAQTLQTERQFDDMVDKYRRKLEGTEQAEKSHRWFDDA